MTTTSTRQSLAAIALLVGASLIGASPALAAAPAPEETPMPVELQRLVVTVDDDVVSSAGAAIAEADRVTAMPQLAPGTTVTVQHEYAGDAGADIETWEVVLGTEQHLDAPDPATWQLATGSYEFTVPFGLTAGTEYAVRLQSVPADGTEGILLWEIRFLAAALSADDCGMPVPAPTSTGDPADGGEAPMPVPTPSGSPSDGAGAVPCAAGAADLRQVNPVPGIVFGSLIGSGVVAAIVTHLIRRQRFALSVRRLAERP